VTFWEQDGSIRASRPRPCVPNTACALASSHVANGLRDCLQGEAANFQGDERDVIIISTVVAVNPAIPSDRVAAMTGNAAMRRINVAASRARQQM
jgi:AAA domain